MATRHGAPPARAANERRSSRRARDVPRTLAVCLSYGGGLPTLWRAPIVIDNGAVGAWEEAVLEANEEARLADDDALPRSTSPFGGAVPLADSGLSFLCGRIATPSRFAPRHISMATSKLLAATANGAEPLPLRAAVQRRLQELEAEEAMNAAAQAREPAARAALERRLGEALLAACSHAKAAPAEITSLVPFGPVPDGPIRLAVLSRSGLSLLLPRTVTPPLPAAPHGAPLTAWLALNRAAASVADDRTHSALSDGGVTRHDAREERDGRACKQDRVAQGWLALKAI